MIAFDELRPVSARARLILVCATLINVASCVHVIEHSRCNSPDEQYVIAMFQIYGGGAAGFSAKRIALVKAGSQIDTDEYLYRVNGPSEVRFEWRSARHLVIGYPETGALERHGAQAAIEPVRIDLVAMPADGSFLEPGKAGCFYSQDSRSESASSS